MKTIAKKKLFLIIPLLLVCLVCVIFSFTAFTAKGERKEGEMLSATQINDGYYLNDVLSISGAKIKYGVQELTAQDITLFYPNGSVKTGESFVLDQVGNYLLQFESKDGNDVIFCEKDLAVYEQLFSVPSNSIGNYVEQLPTMAAQKSGINVELSPSTEFVYNKVINVKNATKDGDPIIKFLPYQYSKEKANTSVMSFNGTTTYPAVNTQANYFCIRLTDCYNPENFVEIRVRECEMHSGLPSYYYPSFGARASGQEIRALTSVSESMKKYGEVVSIDGIPYICKYTSYAFAYEWSALKDNGEISIYFDYAKGRLYGTYPGASKLFFADLTLDSVFGENVFKGFTTGEVYLSVYADEYETDKAGFDITEIYGDTGEELATANVQDTVKPVVVVDIEDVEKVYYVAKGEYVSLPDATCYDVNFKELKKNVYYAYGTDKQVSVNVKDGKFKADKSGEYVIEYVATDLYGNASIPVTVKLNSVSVDGNSVIKFSVDKIGETVDAGASITMPNYTVSSLNGGVSVSSYLYNESAPEEKIYFESGDSLIFDKLGKYTVVYEYQEYFEKHVYSYTVNSVISSEVVFDEAVLPSYLINNATYTLDKVIAYAFSDGVKSQIDVSYYVKEDDGEFVGIDYNAYTVSATESVQFKYVAGGKEKLSSVIKVVDVGFDTGEYAYSLNMSKYFVGDFDQKVKTSGVWLTSNVNQGDNSFEFVNVVTVSSFQFVFKGADGLSNYSAVEVELTDYYDRSNKVTVGVKTENGVSGFYVNNASANIQTNFKEANTTIAYDSINRCFIETTGTQLAWANNFTSERALMKVTLKGITGDSAIIVKDVCRQQIGNVQRDFYGSYIYYENRYGGVQELNSLATIYPAYAIDVLSPFEVGKITVAVSGANGKFITAQDGTVLDGTAIADKEYVLKLSKYDVYYVEYNYTDSYGNTSSAPYSIYVKDDVAPTIKLNDGITSNSVVHVKLNEEYTVKEYTLKDNLSTSALKVEIYAIQEGTQIYKIEKNKIKFTVKGEYQILYYCYDAAGNYSTASYFVLVK